ncbi:uncharacterized protein [Halyomorpha halys]|uniref:uncharacterized protein n=1 Tax=Halyomorpha halys TaxID=286706 RepID=UPI0006D51D4C|nr:uncharacterized protein LOC106682381 [Halyomorpha halys]
MSYTSPNLSHQTNPHFRYSDGFKSPHISPQNNGQGSSPFHHYSPKQPNSGGKIRYFNNSTSPNNGMGFSPYSYSSPNTNRGGRMRYFNSTSPQNHYRNNRDTYHRNNRRSYEFPTPPSAYYHPSMLENPWAELEKEWEEKKKLESNSKNVENSDTSSK